MKIKDRILQILLEKGETRFYDLTELVGASRQMVHRAVRELVAAGEVLKVGSAPKTFYKLAPKSTAAALEKLNEEQTNFLSEHFLVVTETGKKLTGTEAMTHWCARQKLPIEKTVREFIATREKYLAYFNSTGLIDGLTKIKSTKGLETIGLDAVYYLDFYAIERFGKTKLGLLLHLAKQGQNKKLMDEIVTMIKPRVDALVSQTHANAVGYIPPTIKREVQFMRILEKKLNLSLPHIKLVKVSGEIVIPQKALSKLDERVSNARSSIMVSESRKFETVLLIDDAIGSGATINETARKLKERGLAKRIIGLAVTGSFKGFDVIQEV